MIQDLSEELATFCGAAALQLDLQQLVQLYLVRLYIHSIHQSTRRLLQRCCSMHSRNYTQVMVVA